MFDDYAVVLGHDCMGLYRNGKLVVAATSLTAFDIIEGCEIGCDIHEVNITDVAELPKDLEAALVQ